MSDCQRSRRFLCGPEMVLQHNPAGDPAANNWQIHRQAQQPQVPQSQPQVKSRDQMNIQQQQQQQQAVKQSLAEAYLNGLPGAYRGPIQRSNRPDQVGSLPARPQRSPNVPAHLAPASAHTLAARLEQLAQSKQQQTAPVPPVRLSSQQQAANRFLGSHVESAPQSSAGHRQLQPTRPVNKLDSTAAEQIQSQAAYNQQFSSQTRAPQNRFASSSVCPPRAQMMQYEQTSKLGQPGQPQQPQVDQPAASKAATSQATSSSQAKQQHHVNFNRPNSLARPNTSSSTNSDHSKSSSSNNSNNNNNNIIHLGQAAQNANAEDDDEEDEGRKKKYLTAKYGQQQMNLIKKRLKIEMWLYDQLQELAKESKSQAATDDMDVDLDEILDLEDDDSRRLKLKKILSPLDDVPKEKVNAFIEQVLEQSKLL